MKSHSLRGLLLLFPALLLVAASACSSNSNGPAATASPSGSASAAPAASSTPAPVPPEIQRILDRVSQIRQLPSPPTLGVQFVSRSDLPALLDRLLTPEDHAWFATTTRLYRLLGHLSNTQDYETIYRSFGSDAVLGLYSPPQKTLWVVHPDGQQVDLNNLSKPLEQTLAHELVHALQDYNFNLDTGDAAFKDNLDVSLTWTAVLEGDAVTHENIYSDRFLALLPGGVATVIPASANLQIRDVPPSIIRELYFPYTTGAAWIRDTLTAKGTKQIDVWIKNPPAGTAYVLHPELLNNGFQPADVKLPDLASTLGKDWKHDSGGTLGEFGLRNYLQLQLRALDAVNGATGWAGDHYDVYANGDQSVAAFRLHFATADDAAEYARLQSTFFDNARANVTPQGDRTFATFPDGDVTATTAPQGNDVVFTIASNQQLAQKALDALLHG